jgi:4-amino-4-deoxy-L-arabinose transferase-like glycosyltransferase
MPTSQINSDETAQNAGRLTEWAHPTHLDQFLPGLIFASALVYLLLFRNYSIIDPDEGIVLRGAERILQGQVPYRDFFMFYTPGSVYVVAALFKIFGNSLAVARASIAVVGAGCSVIAYLLARRICSRAMALLGAGLTAFASVSYRPIVLHNWYSTFFAFLAIYATIRLWESETKGWALVAGLLIAVTTLIEQSKGAGLCLGFVTGYLILLIFAKHKLVDGAALAFLALGFVVPLIVTFVYFGSTHSVGAMLQAWFWPLDHYSGVNKVSYGYQDWSDAARERMLFTGTAWVRIVEILAISPCFVVPFLPLLGIGWLVYASIQLRKTKSNRSENEYHVLIEGFVMGLLVSILVVRTDISHFMDLAPLWYVVLASVLGATNVQSSLLRSLRPWLTTYVVLAFGLMSLALLLNTNGAHNYIRTRRGVIRTRDEDTVIDYVQARVTAGDELLVYPYLPLYNYLTATRSPARLDFFQSGMNTPEQANEIIQSLQSHEVHAVLFDPGFSETFAVSWPNTPLSAVVTDPVSDYIAHNYRVCQPLSAALGWQFQYMVRKAESCDSISTETRPF